MFNLVVDFSDIVCSQNALHRITEKASAIRTGCIDIYFKIHPKVVHPFINSSAQTNTLQKIINGSKRKPQLHLTRLFFWLQLQDIN